MAIDGSSFEEFAWVFWNQFAALAKECDAIKSIKIFEFGGPEVMRLEESEIPEPGPGQARVKIEVAGVNFIDIYQRTGLYKNPLPYSMGLEGAGIVEAVGPDAAKTLIKPGDRVAWTSVPGSYATHVLAPFSQLVFLPEKLTFEQGAAAMLQGMTAHYLSQGVYTLKFSDTCLIHACAGGVGQLLCQMARMRGARVIGTVSSEEKAKLAKEAGANYVINYTQQDFVSEVKRITEGEGVSVVYDSVGEATFTKSLDCLAKRGLMVSFGQSSGPVPPFDIQGLSARGSLFLTRPGLRDYTEKPEELLTRSADVLGWIGMGKLKLRIDRTYPLSEVAEAHRVLASRETSGKILLFTS